MEPLALNSSKRLLAIVAHPDDETFGIGGTLAYYAGLGVQVTVLCITHGEAGEVASPYLEGYNSVAELRAAELHCAVRAMGLCEALFLDYRDSGMRGSNENHHPQALVNAALERVASDITVVMQSYRPQVVVTHDPLGNYLHPDHIATHQATVSAFMSLIPSPEEEMPAYHPQKLFFYTFNRKPLKLLLRLMPLLGIDPKHYGRNKDIDLEGISSVDFPVHALINYRQAAELREQASRCHASQGGAHREWTMLGRLRRWLNSSRDAFMQAYPIPANGRVSRDLFEDVLILDDRQRSDR